MTDFPFTLSGLLRNSSLTDDRWALSVDFHKYVLVFDFEIVFLQWYSGRGCDCLTGVEVEHREM